jgi:hypothetical protein
MPSKNEPPGAKPFVPGLVKVQMLWTKTAAPTGTMANVMHAYWSDHLNHPVADLASLATYWGTQYITRLGAYHAGSYQLTSVVASSLGGDGAQSVVANGSSGTGSGFALPPQCALCISLLSGIVQRGGRGRVYMPGIPDGATTQADSQEITTAWATNVKTGMNSFITDISGHLISGVGIAICVPSYYTKYTLRPVPVIGLVTGCNVHQRLDSQRRRSGKESLYPRV